MYRLLFPIIIIFSIAFTQTDGDVVKNVTTAQRTDGSKLVDIYYDLEDGDGNYTSYSVYVTADWSGMYHNFPLNNCEGDVWENVIPGLAKQITCQLATPGDDETQYLSGDFYVNVHADGHAVSELPDSFEMIEMDTDDTELVDYNFEMMAYEVTVSQYVEFLNDKLSQATNIYYQDYDVWPEQEGGETYHRAYVFDDGTTIEIMYSNPGGCNLSDTGINQWYTSNYPGIYECVGYVDNNDNGYGYIKGYEDNGPFRFMENEPGEAGLYTWTWLNLLDINASHMNSTGDEITWPKVQFSSTNICGSNDSDCVDDFSFFISEGDGNHPVPFVSIAGADAFADHYGLRLPSIQEYMTPFSGLTSEGYEVTTVGVNNFITFINNIAYSGENFDTIDECNSFIQGNCENWDEHLYPVGSTDFAINGIYDLIGNIGEYVYSPVEGDIQGYPTYDYQWHWIGNSVYSQGNYASHGQTTRSRGFRCVRTSSNQ